MSEPKCPQTWLIEATRDGRMVGVERASFSKHLRGCVDCSEHAQNAESARKKLRELPSGLPDAFTLRRRRRDLLRTFDASLLATTPTRGSRAARVVVGLGFAVAGAVGVWLFCRAPVAPSWVEVVAGPGANWSEQKTNSLDRVTLRNGRFNLRIHRPSPSSRVVLSLPDGEIEDLGTVLEVWAEGDQTSHVAVRSGEVVLRLRELPDVKLRAGDLWDRPPFVKSRPLPQSETKPDLGAMQQVSPGVPAPERGTLNEAKAKVSRAAPIGARNAVLRREQQAQPAIVEGPSDGDAEDAAYLRVLELLDAGRRDEARSAAAEYLARYPHGFRRLEARGIVERLERTP